MDMEEDDYDIFHALLLHDPSRKPDEKSTFNDDDDDCEELPFNLEFSVDPSIPKPSYPYLNVESRVLESILKQGSSILDQCRNDHFLYVLVEIKDRLVVQVYSLDDGDHPTIRPQITVPLPTTISSADFKDRETSTANEERHMYVILPSQKKEQSSLSKRHESSGIIHLHVSTFSSIFGKQTALANSPVILVCTDNGCVFWQPLKWLGGNLSSSKFSLMCQLHAGVKCVMCVSVPHKSGLEEDVAAVLRSAMSAEDDPGKGKQKDGELMGLLAVTAIGECCLMIPSPPSSSSYKGNSCDWWRPLRFCLPHPVVSCAKRDNQLVYSTGSSVESVVLALRDHDKGQPSICLENCVTLTLAHIVRLFFHQDSTLMGVTSDMDVIPIPTTALSSSSSSPPSSSQTSSSSPDQTATHPSSSTNNTNLLPDTLRRIDQHTATIKALHAKSNTLDTYLLQLNLYASLLQQCQRRTSAAANKQHTFNFNNTDGNRDDIVIIRCECFCHHNHDSKKSSEVRIRLKNDTSVQLSDQWSVQVTAVGESLSLSLPSKPNPETATYCFQMPAEGFRAGSVKTFSMPLPEFMTSDLVPQVSLSVSLVLCVGKELPRLLPRLPQSVVALDSPLLEVAIHRQTLDCLHLLKVIHKEEEPRSLIQSRVDRTLCLKEIERYLDRLREKRLCPPMKKSSSNSIGSPESSLSVKINIPECMSDRKMDNIFPEAIMNTLLQSVQNISTHQQPHSVSCVSPAGTRVTMTLLASTSRGTETGDTNTHNNSHKTSKSSTPSLELRLDDVQDIVLLYTVSTALMDRFKDMTEKELHGSPGKSETDLKLKARLSALTDIGQHIARSSTEKDSTASLVVCQALQVISDTRVLFH